MKMPNGYGSVVKLSGTRRKPWAVRISYLEEQKNGTVRRKQKYLAYFAEQKSALTYLAEYNNGIVVKELQDCLTAQSSKSCATIGNMRAILRGMWQYAIANEYTEKDITQHLVFDFTESGVPIHTRFTDDEICKLWDALWTVNNVDIVLIYIYTGLRPSELLDIESSNVHLADRYMIGGMKTEAGRNRIVPIHEAIAPLVEYRLNQNRPYLITNKYGNHYTRAVYQNSNWNTLMQKIGMNHAPHDCRYTFAALADRCGMNETCRKIIMGHTLSNRDGSAYKTGGLRM